MAGARTSVPIIVEVACVAGNTSPLCAPEPEPEPATIAIQADISITATTDTATVGTADLSVEAFLDYEVVKVVPLEELVAPLDTSLEEDDDFEDVPGVLSQEQAAGIIEDLEEQLAIPQEEVEFKEELIPVGDLPPPPEEELAQMTETEIAEIQAQNAYAGELTQAAAQRRLERQAQGFEDKPPAPAAPPKASPEGDLEIDFGKALSLFGDTDVSGRRFLPTSRSGARRFLQSEDGGQSFNIDVRRFMSFELVRGESSASEKRLRFTPKLGDFTGSKMKIKFDFENPLYVSTGDTPDRIIAQFTDPRMLMDPDTGMFVQTPGMITELPRMLLSDDATEILGASCFLVASATNTLIVVLVLVAFSLVAMTKSIWQFVNTIQILAYMRWFVEWPANADLGY